MTSPRPWPRRARLTLWFGVLLSWVILLPMVWTAFSTVPSLERLAQSRMVQIPTLRTVGLLVARSAAEVGVLLAVLYPLKPRFYLSRLWIAGLGVWAWFIASTPLGLTRMWWIHRRWLALLGAVLVVVAGLGTMVRTAEAIRGPDREGGR